MSSQHVRSDAHASSMRNHVQQLGAKSYQSQFEEAPDYVVMFVPGEHFVAAALEQDPSCGISPSSAACCWRRRPIWWPSAAPWPRSGGRTGWRVRRARSAAWAASSTIGWR